MTLASHPDCRAAGIGERGIINSFTNVLYDFTRREVEDSPPRLRGVVMIEALLADRRAVLFGERRSLEHALVDLLATYGRAPDPQLARTIELLRAEIELRERPARFSVPSS